MIGLRVLHLALSLSAARCGDVVTMMGWLEGQGHHCALATASGGSLPGIDLIPYRQEPAAWWMGGRRQLLSHAAAWNPDLIHVHGLPTLSAGRALARHLSLPLLVSIDQRLGAAAVRGLRDAAIAWVLVPTEAQRAHLVGTLRFDRDLVCVLPFAVDCARWRALHVPAHGIGSRDLVVGMAATHPESGLGTVLDAVARLRRDGQPIRLRLPAPAADQAEALAAAIAGRHGADWVDLETSDDPLAALVTQSDIIVHPAEDERSSVAVPMAMASGRPVVAGGVAGMSETIVDGHSGILVPPADAGALAAALGRLLRGADLRYSLATGAVHEAREKFDVSVVGPATLELYCSAMSVGQNTCAKAEGSRSYTRRLSDSHLG